MAGNGWELAFQDPFKEAIHVICTERRHKSAHLVRDTAQRPDVRLQVVGLVLPDLGTGVVGSSRLRVQQSLLGDFGYVEIAKLRRLVLV